MPSEQMPRLNLPDYTSRLRLRLTTAVEIYDPTRSLWVRLTPEEWVRQNMTLYLSERLELPLTRFRNEAGIDFNGLKKRCDTIIYTRNGLPLAIAEYKRPDVAITQAVFNQIAVYNLRLHVPWLIVSNGLTHFMCQADEKNKRYIFTDKLNYHAI